MKDLVQKLTLTPGFWWEGGVLGGIEGDDPSLIRIRAKITPREREDTPSQTGKKWNRKLQWIEYEGLFTEGSPNNNIAKGTTDPRVEFILPK